jgi:hypothetical protein
MLNTIISFYILSLTFHDRLIQTSAGVGSFPDCGCMPELFIIDVGNRILGRRDGPKAVSDDGSDEEGETMKLRVGRRFFSFFAGTLLLGFVAVPALAWLPTVSGEAYGVSVNVAGVNGTSVTVPKTPDVVLPPGGGTEQNQIASITIPGTLASQTLAVTTTGSINGTNASAQSSAAVEHLNILNGLVTADSVVAVASSTGNGTTASSSAAGSTLLGLTVGGVVFGNVTPLPNTVIPLPGVGNVILNEQSTGGDGVSTTSLTVNMIHVVLSGSLGSGDIVVSSAHSDVTVPLF